MECVVWKTSVSRRDCPADCRLGKLKKPGDRLLPRSHEEARPGRRATPPAPQGGAPSRCHPWCRRRRRRRRPLPRRTKFRTPLDRMLSAPTWGPESRVELEYQTRGARHAHILLWFIAEGPLGALSHDSDSDEPQPLLYMDELGTASPELLLALPCMDEPPPLVD